MTILASTPLLLAGLQTVFSSQTWELLAAPLAACVVLTGIHCYLGIHVLMREVIFVDLALAQIAALGAAVGTLAGFHQGEVALYLCSLGFTFVGAAVFSLSRFRDGRVPQEAIIGIVYAVSSAAAILIFSKSAVEREEIEQMLKGRLLFVEWPEIFKMFCIYAAVGTLHVLCRRPFFAISRGGRHASAAAECGDGAAQLEARRKHGANAVGHVRWWDFVFYMSFGLVVTSSVQIAGVLLVFAFLVAPAVIAMMFFDSVAARLTTGWVLGMLATGAGLVGCEYWDVDPAVSIVTMLGGLVLLASIGRAAASFASRDVSRGN